VEWIIQYQITDARAWLFGVDNQEKTIRDISQSVINMLVGDRTIFDVIGAERAAIEVQGQDLMNELYKSYGLGVRVTTVSCRTSCLPRLGAGRLRRREQGHPGPQQAYQRGARKPTTRRSQGQRPGREQTIQEADGYATERVNQAKGDVARFLGRSREYRQAPDVVRTRLYYEMYDQVFGNREGTDLIDKNLKNFLPLKSVGAGAPAPTPSVPAAPAPAAGDQSQGATQ